MRCSRCKKKSDSLVICYDVVNHKRGYVCYNCLYYDSYRGGDIESLDKQLREGRSLLSRFEEILEVADEPDLNEYPKNVAALLMTPSKAARSLKALLAELEKERQAVLSGMPVRERLNYELKQSVRAEDYEKAAKLRNTLADLNRKK